MSLPARMRMLQLASQALPVGGYSHSQGLEAAIEAGIVCDEPTLLRWMSDVLCFTLGRYELPMLRAFGVAWQRREPGAVERLNQEFLASRESAELRSASVQMGFSLRALARVLPDTPDWFTATLLSVEEPALPCVWSGLGCAWGVSIEDSLAAFAWSWAENQVLVAVKTVPARAVDGSAGAAGIRRADCTDRDGPCRRRSRAAAILQFRARTCDTLGSTRNPVFPSVQVLICP